MASAERESLTGVWGRCPQRVPGRAPGQEVPPEAGDILLGLLKVHFLRSSYGI